MLGGMIGLSIANARKYSVIRQNEEKLRENARELQLLNENKDKFFSILSHDLKGPFNALLGFSALMSKDLNQFTLSDIQNMMKRINNSAENLFKLLENLLEWSSIQRGMVGFQPVICKIPEIVEQIIAVLSLQAEKKDIRFFDRIQPGTEVVADYHMLNTIIRNLISNAIKFSQRHGFIYIMVEKNDDQVFELSVRDEGIGISQELQKSLFVIDAGKNRQGTDNEPSTGLGLLLCKEYVDKHQGEIWVVSDQEKGSSFHFTIPKTRQATASAPHS
jgi:signal transduction histidine kinase